MADMRARDGLSGELLDVRSDPQGRIVVEELAIEIPFGPTTGAVSLTTDMLTRLAKRQFKLLRVEAKWSTAPTTSENFTVTVQAARGSTQFDTVIFTNNPSVGSVTSVVNTWTDGYDLFPGDELVVAYTNTDAKTIGGRLVVRPVT